MIEGYINMKPEIKAVEVNEKDKIKVSLKDGRILILPINKFKSIEELNIKQRRQIQILGTDAFTFDNCPEVYHIEQLFGSYIDYKHI